MAERLDKAQKLVSEAAAMVADRTSGSFGNDLAIMQGDLRDLGIEAGQRAGAPS